MGKIGKKIRLATGMQFLEPECLYKNGYAWDWMNLPKTINPIPKSSKPTSQNETSELMHEPEAT